MSLPRLIVAAGKEKALQRHHPWLFSGAVARIEGQPEEGDLVEVCTADGHWMATGHYQSGTIACKVLSFDTRTIDREFFRHRIRSAIAYRERMGFFAMPTTNVFRLIHAEGDFLPGLVADWYNGILVLQAHSMGMHRIFPLLAQLMQEELTPYGLKAIFDKSSATLNLPAADGYLWGIEPAEWEFTEWGNRMAVNFFEGQKTGFFIDQRDNRALLERYAHDKSVLNMFCYTGGFSFYAMRGGAKLVHSVDSSAKAIELTNRNVELNFPGDQRHEAFCDDAFKFLDASDGQYNLIILDPPAFAKHRGALHNALKGYTRLNQKAFEKLPAGGLLFTFSCSQVVTKDQFRQAVFTAAALAHRKVRILHQLHQPADHPINIYHPEGEYLKGLVVYVE